jgi:hypothetical protein
MIFFFYKNLLKTKVKITDDIEKSIKVMPVAVKYINSNVLGLPKFLNLYVYLISLIF